MRKLLLLLLALLIFGGSGAWATDVLPNATVSAYFVQETPTMTVGGGTHTITKDGSGNVTISPNNSGSFGATSGRFNCTLVVKINVPSTTTAGVLCDLRPASDNVQAAQGLYMNTGCKLQTSWGYNGSITPRTAGSTLTAGEHTIIYTTGESGAVVYIDGTSNTLSDTGLKASGVSYKAIYIPAAYASYITEVHFYPSIQSAANITAIASECANHIYASQHAEEESVTVGSGKGLIIDTDANLSKFSGADGASSIGVAYGKTLTVSDAAFNSTYLSKIYGTGTVDVYETQTAGFETCPTNIVYYGGAGTTESRVSINHNGGSVKLTGAEKTYYLTESCSATNTTVNFDGTNASYSDALGIGSATYNINNTKITTPRFITSQGGNNRAAVVNLTGNTCITVTGNSNVDSNQSSIMIGHWNGSSNLTLSNTVQIEAVDAQMLIGLTRNTQTITLNDNSNITAKGIKVSTNASGTNTLNLNGGSLDLGDVGITSYGTTSIAVNVNENSTITATASTLPISQPITVASGKTLTIDGGESNAELTLSGSLTNNGTISFSNATFTINLSERDLSGYTFTDCDATAQFVETTDEYKAGGFKITSVPSGVTIKVKKYGASDYETVTPEAGTATFSHSVEVSGTAAWFDYTFNETTLATNQPATPIGNIPNRGNAGSGQTLTIDNSKTSAVSYNSDGTFKVRYTPYRGMTWPENYTVAVSGNFPDVENGCLVAFGTKWGNYLALIRGANSNEIKLVKGQGDNTYTNIQTMAAENSTAAAHLVVFTKQGNVFKVYCDGVNVATTTYDQTLGGGLQVGSIHGGYANTGVVSVMDNSLTDDQKNAVFCNAIRVYDYIISNAQMEALKNEFPYVSQGGNYTRTISANANLDAEDAWYNVGEETNTNLPTNNTVEEVTYYPDIVVTTTAASTLTVNANMDSRNIEFDGAGKLTIASDGTHSISIKGSVTANGPISVKYGAIDMSAVPVSIGESGSIEFDFSDYDFSGVTTSTDYPVTGLTSNYGAKVTSVYPDDEDHTYSLAFNSTTNSYYLTVGPSVTLKQKQAIALVTPYYNGNHVGAGLGKYTISLGETSYANMEDFGDAVTAWATIGDCVEPIIAINQPTTGKFYRFKGNTTGYYISNESELYQGTYYKLYKHTSEENKAIFYLENNNSNNYLLSYGSGLYNNTNKDGDWAWGTGLSNAKTVVFSEGNIGFYRIQSAGQIYFYDADNSLDRGTSDGHDRYKKWTIEEVTSLPITFKGKYASFYSPVDLEIPEGVKAYTAGTIHGGWITLDEIVGTTLPHNTGVILKYDAYDREATVDANTMDFTILSTTTVGSSKLDGTYAAKSCDEDSKLVLGYENSAWGIYKYHGTTLGGFKAYMDIMPEEGEIKGFTFSFNNADAIVSVLNGEQQQGECYDLSGRRVSKPTRGLYIVGGKKVMVK